MYSTSSDNTAVYVVLLLASMVICGSLSSHLAKKKGQNAGAWFACGFFFSIFGLIAAAGLPMKTSDVSLDEGEFVPKECPDCAEVVKVQAKVCSHCGHRFTTEENSHNALKALDDRDPALRVSAIRALERIGDKSAAPRIMDVLENASKGEQNSWDWCLALENAAGKALKVLATEALVPRLVAQVEAGGQSTNAKLRSLEVLSAMGGSSAAPTLVKALGNKSTAELAAVGLERLGESAIPHLERAEETGSRAVQKAATKLLESIRSKQPE